MQIAKAFFYDSRCRSTAYRQYMGWMPRCLSLGRIRLRQVFIFCFLSFTALFDSRISHHLRCEGLCQAPLWQQNTLIISQSLYSTGLSISVVASEYCSNSIDNHTDTSLLLTSVSRSLYSPGFLAATVFWKMTFLAVWRSHMEKK